jgi:hypothetical protein
MRLSVLPSDLNLGQYCTQFEFGVEGADNEPKKFDLGALYVKNSPVIHHKMTSNQYKTFIFYTLQTAFC